MEGDLLYLFGGSHAHSAPAGMTSRSLDTVWIFDLRRSADALVGTASGFRRTSAGGSGCRCRAGAQPQAS